MKCPYCRIGDIELEESENEGQNTIYYYACTNCDAGMHTSESDDEQYWEPPTKMHLKDVIEFIKVNNPKLDLSLIKALTPEVSDNKI